MSATDIPAGGPGDLMAAEIAEQPAILDRLLSDGIAEIADVSARIRRFAPRFVVLAARGTSDHAALYAKYLAEIRMAVPAGLASPSSMTVYGARPDLGGVLFLAVSQSGGSPDLVDSLSAARACGALTVAVTNNPASELAAAADLQVDVRAGVERAVAATKSYTAQLLALYLLLAGARNGAGGGNGAGRNGAGQTGATPAEVAAPLAAAVERTLATGAGVAAAQRYRQVDRLVLTGRGYSYPSAREAALKLMETSYLSAQAFSGADLLHGPLAMIDAAVPVIALVPPGRGGAAMAPVLERLAATGADVLPVGRPDGIPLASEGIAEELLPILEILPLQQLAWRLALDRGADPDCPRGLAKVTRTW
jgi:glutamine---fructose-6-phosphate transaminase (isomerizing)